MKKVVLILVSAAFFFWPHLISAQGDLEGKPFAARLGIIVYDRLTPKVNDLNNINRDLRSILKSIENDRKYNILAQVIWCGEMIAAHGHYEIRLLGLHEKIKDEAKNDYYRDNAIQTKAAAKVVRDRLEDIKRLFPFIKDEETVALVEKVINHAAKMAGDLDITVLMLEQQAKGGGGPIKEQTIK
ncbi:MAG: hypothetical protein AB1641_00135 [Thermodesulfobacteriota bacterium]